MEKDNVVFVTSAGNAGPALSTCGAPEPLSDVVVGGAYVSSKMMSAQRCWSAKREIYYIPQNTNRYDHAYISPQTREFTIGVTLLALRARTASLLNIPQTAFTWTSVGPSRNGHLGVTTWHPVLRLRTPTWCLKFKQQMNGTSMASPNAAGVVALILSKLKKDKISYMPRIVRSIENTAKDVRGVVKPAQGQGLIQALSAYVVFLRFRMMTHNTHTHTHTHTNRYEHVVSAEFRRSDYAAACPVDVVST